MVISDVHLTERAEETAAMREAVTLAATRMDAVLLLGDNTNNSHAQEHDLVLRWAREIRQRTGAEVFILPGNHDYGARMGRDEFLSLYGVCGWEQAFARDTATASCAVMSEGGTCLLLLDTNRFGTSRTSLPDGGITGGTLQWLREVLEQLPEGTPVLACGHHPILPAGRDERTPGAAALGSLLRSFGIGLYLCGHDHGFATLQQGGLRQITVGQPQAYPGWAGVIECDSSGFHWHTKPIYDHQSPGYAALRQGAADLARSMASGSLKPTPYAEDEATVEWFVTAFMALTEGELTPEKCAALLADENCLKWRRAQTKTVVKDWIPGSAGELPGRCTSA